MRRPPRTWTQYWSALDRPECHIPSSSHKLLDATPITLEETRSRIVLTEPKIMGNAICRILKNWKKENLCLMRWQFVTKKMMIHVTFICVWWNWRAINLTMENRSVTVWLNDCVASSVTWKLLLTPSLHLNDQKAEKRQSNERITFGVLRLYANRSQSVTIGHNSI